MLSVQVIDPFGVADDPEMPFLSRALDPAVVRCRIENGLTGLSGEKARAHLRAVRVTRYKPERRCLIEYDLEVEKPDGPIEPVTLVGKTRARAPGQEGFSLLRSLWRAGFGADSADQISVPEPVGMIPEFRMWIQRKVPGTASTGLLGRPGGAALAGRIAEAIHKLHLAGIPAGRRHTMADELHILHERLSRIALMRPRWSKRIRRLLDACDRLGAAVPEPGQRRPIHRDFYPDHVIVDGPRLYLIDFDLYCEGDPALDAGNFLGHLTEQGLRRGGDHRALLDREEALEERFVELTGAPARAAVRAYAALTLARHIYLSTLFAERRPFTAGLLELCEQRLLVTGRYRS